MKQEQDSESDEGIQKTAMEESWAVIGYDHGVIGEAGYGEDKDDHDRPERTQGRTELEHVPRHCCFEICRGNWKSNAFLVYWLRLEFNL